MLQKILLLNFSHSSSPHLCRERWGESKKNPSHTKQGQVKLKSSAISQPAIERISCNLFSDCRACFFPQGLGETFPAFMKGLKLSSIFHSNILVQGKGMERKKTTYKSFTLNGRYRAWSHRTPCARLLLWAQQQRVPFPLHPALSAPFALPPPPVVRLLWLKVRELSPLHRHTIRFTMLQDEGQRWLEANGRSR